MGSITVQVKKRECRGNGRVSAICKPIDAVNNTLIDLFLAQNIRIEGFNGKNVVNVEPITIRSNIENLIGSVN